MPTTVAIPNQSDTRLDAPMIAGRRQRPAARITRVETIPLHVPFATPFRIAIGPARSVAEIMIVRLHTDVGIEGIGETQAWRRIGSDATLHSLTTEIRDLFAPCVVGRSPFDAPAILRDCDKAASRALCAKAAVADALLDLQARLLEVPAWALLGGRARATVGACAVLPLAETISLTVDAALDFVAQGYRSATLKVGVNAEDDIALVNRLRSEVPQLTLRPDANATLSDDSAARLIPALKDAGVEAIEQPLAPDALEAMAELTRRFDMPLIADESVHTREDLLRVIAAGAAFGVQTKVAKNGGAWKTRTLWEIADAAGMHIYPGNHPATSVATASVLQLAAAWPGELAEGPFAVGIAGSLARDIVVEPLRVVHGQVAVPEGPGFGVMLDEDAIASMRIDLG